MKWTQGRSLGVFCAVMTGTLALAGCGGSSASGSGRGPIDYALLTSLTGVESVVAPNESASQLSALYEINAAGGVLGHKVNNVVVDSKSDPADGVLALSRALSTSHIVSALGPGTGEAAALVPILQRAHIITQCGCGNPQFDRTTDPYFWRLVPSDPVGGEVMALDAKQLHYTRVAAVFGTDTGSQGDLPGVLLGVKRAKLRLVANIGLTPGQTSYRTQASQLLAAKPQVIFTETDPQTAATFFGEVKQLGALPPIFGTNATISTLYLKTLGAAIGATDLASHYQGENPAPSPVGSKATQQAVNAYSNGIRHVGSQLPKPLSQFLNNPFIRANYDAVTLSALAMTAAHSINPVVADPWIRKVTTPGKGKTIVYSYAQGVAALKAGKQIQYIGASGPIMFDKWHNSFGNQVMEKVTASGAALSTKLFTAAQVQQLG